MIISKETSAGEGDFNSNGFILEHIILFFFSAVFEQLDFISGAGPRKLRREPSLKVSAAGSIPSLAR